MFARLSRTNLVEGDRRSGMGSVCKQLPESPSFASAVKRVNAPGRMPFPWGHIFSLSADTSIVGAFNGETITSKEFAPRDAKNNVRHSHCDDMSRDATSRTMPRVISQDYCSLCRSLKKEGVSAIHL
eukprot:1193865-Prorocentrum_minimum.AAC.1